MKRTESYLILTSLTILVMVGVLFGAKSSYAITSSEAQSIVNSMNLTSSQATALVTFLNLTDGQSSVLNTAVTGNVNPPIIIPPAVVTTGVVSAEVFNLNVDYSHFASEETQNHYTSVYSSSGTKPVAITVFKFNDSATMTVSQIIAKITSLGYRPATLDETYALGQAGKWSVVGLGTLLGSYNVYPYTVSNGKNGLYSSAGPFSMQAYRFAAVNTSGTPIVVSATAVTTTTVGSAALPKLLNVSVDRKSYAVGDQAYISWIKTFESSSDSYIRISLFSNNNGWSVPVTSASNLSLNQTLFSARIPQNVPIIGGEYLFVVEVCNSSGVCSQYDSSHFTIVAAATSTIPAVTSSSVYTLNVNYDKFDSEEAQNHYVSVYSDSGTKSAAITVFKFNDSATMTADQIKTKLASLGYRPATLDETYALGQAGKWSIVGLGTLLGSYNVYPYTMVGVANNLYSSAGPFDTQTFSFAGVSLGASVSNPNVTIGTCSTGQSWNGSACAWTVAVDNSQHSTLDAANGDLVGQNIVPPAQTQTVLAQNTVATSTVAVISVPPASTATSDTYTLNIDYSHFASEESQYHYTSVYSSTGTKSTAITVFKFTDSSTMTADQVKTKLASLGYRPATLDETYALGQAGKWNVIGLGTSMGSFNVYPLTLNGASTGLYNIGATAAYSTQLYKFAAVKL